MTTGLNLQTPLLWSVEWDSDLSDSRTTPAYTETLDNLLTYPNGICGEKVIEFLDPSFAPSFLTLVLGANRIEDPFTITYNQPASDSSIGQQTVRLYVTNYEYSRQTYEEFVFEITCPDLVPPGYSTLDQVIATMTEYDVASGGKTVTLTAPVISFTPAQCWSVQSFSVIDTTTLLQPDYIQTVSTS